ncbi:hypothetical protein [Candidatus Clostridium helianthi]|uniref:TVP38/TMEM64 family membrane protein n=1 Tax=Candidatus Clostridium helianthi TaxID=3381660 RepID=A0ABW8S6G5_9CLOT
MFNINDVVEILRNNSSIAIPISLIISIVISLVGILPSGIITLAASISNVDSTIFTVATLIGKVPSIALEALVSYDIINIYDNWIRLVITVIGLIFVKFTITKKKDD